MEIDCLRGRDCKFCSVYIVQPIQESTWGSAIEDEVCDLCKAACIACADTSSVCFDVQMTSLQSSRQPSMQLHYT